MSQRSAFKILVLMIVTTTILLGCNQTKSDSAEKSHENKQVENPTNEMVSLTVEPNVFKLSELPDLVDVTITNNTNDTITTGMHYRIENFEKNKWKEVSPEQFFNDLGWTIEPSGFHTFETKLLIHKIDYKAGTYRIIKSYLKSDYQKNKKEFSVYAEFYIE